MMKCLQFISVVFASLNIAWSQENVVSKDNLMCITPECNCCLESVLCVNGVCNGQCKDGYHGSRCRNKCPQNCITCRDADNPLENKTLWGVSNCTECKPGYFSTTEFYQCQFNCSSPCQTCMSETVCISCVHGYYLSGTTCHQCIQECTACLSHTICNSCHDGYYLSGSACRECRQECTTCSSLTLCNSCKDGYYLSGTVCLACESGCSKCLSATTCSSCQDGFFISGTKCFRCQEECRTCISEITCSSCITEYVLSDGVCLLCPRGCEVCSSQIQCEQCKGGYYPSEGVCFSCPNSCVSCTSLDRCTSCKIGYDLSAGQCILCPLSCISCTSDSHCTECQDGYYLTDGFNKSVICRRCSLGCTAGQCSKLSGICQCKATFTRDKCDRCIDGRFGEDCLSYCPANCRYDNCDKISGSCLGDCFSDFSGDQCCLEGPGCQYCASEHICAECIPGKHGSLCDKDCPENCVDRLCHKDTGVCHHVKKPDRIGIIVGGVTGTLVVIAMVTAFIFFYRRRRYILQEGTMNADLNEAYDNFAADDQETEEHNYEDVLDQTSSK